MRPRSPYVEGVEDGIDFDERYTIAGRPGVAWKLWGWALQWEPTTSLDVDEDGNEVEVDFGEGEWVADGRFVLACMVGDDRYESIDRDDLILLAEDGYCLECGQTGCEWHRAEVDA